MGKKEINGMAVNDPYSRDEIDLKLENLFQRFQMETIQREERLEAEARQREAEARQREERIQEEFRKIDVTFRLIEKDINWIKLLLTGSNLGLFMVLIGVILPMAWTLWANLVHIPGN
jgi:hypothetical protein